MAGTGNADGKGNVSEGGEAAGLAGGADDGGAGGVHGRGADAQRAVSGVGGACEGEGAAGDGHHERERGFGGV